MTSSPSPLTRSDRRDLWATLIVGGVAAAGVTVIAVQRLTDLFVQSGVTTMDVPTSVDGVTFPLSPEGSDVTGTVTQARLSLADLPPVVVGSFVLDIVATALGCLAVIALAVVLCVRFMRGRFFDRGASRILAVISILLLAIPIAGAFFRNMGLNGVYASVGSDFTGMSELFWAGAPVYLAAMAVGALAIAFRQGERLQRDTEGLV